MMDVRSSRLVLKPFTRDYVNEFAQSVRESIDVVGEWAPWCQKVYSVENAKEYFVLCGRKTQLEEAYDIAMFKADEDI